jgi:sugar phosphate permease
VHASPKRLTMGRSCVQYAVGQLGLGAVAERAGSARGLAVCFTGVALAMVAFAELDSSHGRTAAWGFNGLCQAQVGVL